MAADPRADFSAGRGFRNYIYKGGDEDGSQYAPAVNVSKILQLYVGPMMDRNEIRKMSDWTTGKPEKCWDNWAYKKINNVVECNKIVFLKSDNMQFSIDVENKFTDMSIQGVLDKMSGNLKGTGTETILNAINGGLEFLNDVKNSRHMGENYKDYMGALYIPKYANIKAWEGMQPIKYTFPTFKFSFGQYGLYNARREVVEPIIAICSCFLPTKAKDDNGNEVGYRWQGPIATPNAQLITILRFLGGQGAEFAKSLKENIGNVFGGSGGDEGGNEESESKQSLQDKLLGTGEKAIDTAINIKDSIYAAFDNANDQLLRAAGNKLAYFRLGWGSSAAVMGPFYIQSVKPQFDFKNTDILGFPTSGSITFEGVTTPLIGNATDMDIFGFTENEDANQATSAPPPRNNAETK